MEHDLKLGDEFFKNLDAKTAAKMKEKRVSKYVEDGAYIVESVDEFLKALFNKDNIESFLDQIPQDKSLLLRQKLSKNI